MSYRAAFWSMLVVAIISALSVQSDAFGRSRFGFRFRHCHRVRSCPPATARVPLKAGPTEYTQYYRCTWECLCDDPMLGGPITATATHQSQATAKNLAQTAAEAEAVEECGAGMFSSNYISCDTIHVRLPQPGIEVSKADDMPSDPQYKCTITARCCDGTLTIAIGVHEHEHQARWFAWQNSRELCRGRGGRRWCTLTLELFEESP